MNTRVEYEGGKLMNGVKDQAQMRRELWAQSTLTGLPRQGSGSRAYKQDEWRRT